MEVVLNSQVYNIKTELKGRSKVPDLQDERKRKVKMTPNISNLNNWMVVSFTEMRNTRGIRLCEKNYKFNF